MLRLSHLIDWCYLNNVEFHAMNMAVAVSTASPVEDLYAIDQTTTQQAATFAALTTLIASKAGRGACSMSLGYFDGSYDSDTGTTYAGLYTRRGALLPSYDAIKNALITLGSK